MRVGARGRQRGRHRGREVERGVIGTDGSRQRQLAEEIRRGWVWAFRQRHCQCHITCEPRVGALWILSSSIGGGGDLPGNLVTRVPR